MDDQPLPTNSGTGPQGPTRVPSPGGGAPGGAGPLGAPPSGGGAGLPPGNLGQDAQATGGGVNAELQTGGTGGGPPETPLDAGSQALAEAFRSSFNIIRIVMIILVAVFLASGFFTVGPQQQAIILRLGRPVTKGREALLGPGLHYSFPYPIDEAVIVSISGLQQVRSSIGWFAVTPEEEMAHTEQTYMLNQPLNPVVDGYVITGDANIVHARATLTYHISDPIRYVFDFASGSNTVQNLLNSALLEVASRYKVDDLLTTDVIGFKDAVRRRTTELLERQNLGLVVDECTVETRPPRQLQEAFRNVIQAEVKRSTAISDARTYENQTLARAGSDAAARTNLARAAVTRYLNDVASRAKQFQELLPKYQQNPDLFVQQRLAETIGRALTNVNDKFFVTRSAEGDRKELRLQLNREPINPQPATPAKP